MAKAGTLIKDASGTTWRATEGGHWRAEDGPQKGKLYSGKGDPIAAPAAAPAPAAAAPVGAQLPAAPVTPAVQQAAATPVNNANTVNAPTQLSPSATEYLNGVKNDLQTQVNQGYIPQATADTEYQRRQNEAAAMSPGQQEAALKAYQDLKAGKTDLQGFDKQLYQNQVAADVTAPQPAKETPLVTASDVIKATSDTAANTTPAGNILTNPNQETAFGNQTVTTDPITGQPIVKQELSEGNQKVVDKSQDTAVTAGNALGGLLGQNGSLQQFINNAAPQSGPSQDLINAIYGNLTTGFQSQKAREQEQLSQTLQNRGIPVGSDAWKNAQDDFALNWNQKEGNARNTAVTNAYGQAVAQQGANTQSLSALTGTLNPLGALQGAGYYAPNLQQFASVGYNQPNVGDIFNTLTGQQIAAAQNATEIEKQKIASDTQKELAAKAASAGGGGGGGGGGSGGTVKSPFTTPPPGS